MRARPLIAVVAGLLLVLAPGIQPFSCPLGSFSNDPLRIVVTLTATPGETSAGELVDFDVKVVSIEDDNSDDTTDYIRRFRWDLDGRAGFEVATGQVPTIGRRYADTGSVQEIDVEVMAIRPSGLRKFGKAHVRILPANGPGQGGPTTPGDPLAPTARVTATPNPAQVGQNVTFDGSASTDPRHAPLRYMWDLDGNGSLETDSGNNPTLDFNYPQAGTYPVRLRVIEQGGRSNDATVDLRVTEAGAAALAAARGRRFSARIALVAIRGQAGKLRRHGAIRERRGLMALGGVDGKLSGPPRRALAPLLDARWLTRVNITTSTRTGALTLRGLALASSKGDEAGQACLRLRFTGRRGGRSGGSFRVLGASGASAGLAGTGTFGYRLDRQGKVRLRGLAKLGGGGRTTIPRACRRLETIGP
jgi:hypothetical protein